ncbi:iron permease, partial [Pilatotrama ljubarskyi]
SPKTAGKWDLVFWMVYLSSVIVDMLSALDLTAVSTTLPTIVSSLDGTDFIWAGGAYTVASSAVLPFIGHVVSVFGRKPVFLAFVLVFALGSGISGSAQNMNMLIAGRAVQGFGGGGCLSVTEIIYADLVPLPERGKLQGMTAAAWAFACAIGPPIGGALAQHGAWRWLFFLNIPICAIALQNSSNLIFLRTSISPDRDRTGSKRMDLPGASLVTGSTVLIFVAMTWGGIEHAWSSPQVLVLLVVGLLGMGAFFVIERSWIARPTVPRSFYTDRTTLAGYLGTFLHGISSLATIYYYPVYLQAAQEASALGSDVDMLMLAAFIPAAAIVAGLSVQVLNGYRFQNYIGWAVTIVGFGLLSLLDQRSSRALYLALQIPVSIGLGIVWISTQFAVLAPLSASEITHALAFFTFTRMVAQGWGIVVGGTILQNVLIRDLPTSFTSRLPDGAQIAYAAIGTISSLPESLREEVRAAFARATRLIWLVTIGISVAGLLSCLLMREVQLRAGDSLVVDEEWRTLKEAEPESSPISPSEEVRHSGLGPQSVSPTYPLEELASPVQESSLEAGLLPRH